MARIYWINILYVWFGFCNVGRSFSQASPPLAYDSNTKANYIRICEPLVHVSDAGAVTTAGHFWRLANGEPLIKPTDRLSYIKGIEDGSLAEQAQRKRIAQEEEEAFYLHILSELADMALTSRLVTKAPQIFKFFRAARAAKVTAKEGVTISRAAIQFGKTENQIYHAFRHTDALGIERSIVQSAIKEHFPSVASKLVEGKSLNSIIKIGEQKIQYSAFKLSDGIINIGRIHGVK